MVITTEQVHRIQSNAQRIRNICILAHIDHGKTTLSDSLLASNGIISQKQAGQIRYLDSRADEQDRGITMKSSCLALHYISPTPSTEYLINMIDCPGHVDFSSEVSIASRLCDGALIIVDVVEGVCTQTYTVLHHAYVQHLSPVLVFNKLDRLITGLRMMATEAFVLLEKLIQQVNAIWATFVNQSTVGFDGKNDSQLHTHHEFSPQAGNVVFACALNGWAFRIHDFAQLYATKLNLKHDTLLQYLWGDYYLDPKTKKVLQPNQLKGRQSSLKPLAVQFMLDNIWAIYDAFGQTVSCQTPEQINYEKLSKIISTLQLKLPAMQREIIARKSNPIGKTKSASSPGNILSAWLPLSPCLLMSIVQIVPSPAVAQRSRLRKVLPMLNPNLALTPSLVHSYTVLRESTYACDASNQAPVLAYISKLITIKKHALPSVRNRSLSPTEIQLRRDVAMRKYNAKYNKDRLNGSDCSSEIVKAMSTVSLQQREVGKDEGDEEDNDDDDVIIGMTRIYSGRITVGDKLYVLGPKYDPEQAQIASEIAVKQIYLLMGPDVHLLNEVYAGNVFGIRAQSNAAMQAVVKCATLSSTLLCPSLATVVGGCVGIVRVAVEPINPSHMDVLLAGLAVLEQSDPAVELSVSESGEHVISASGELHLQRCLVDLRENYAKCPFSVSDPIVPFRETIIVPQINMSEDDELDHPKPAPTCTIKVTTPDKLCQIELRIVPIPEKLVQVLISAESRIRTIMNTTRHSTPESDRLHVQQLIADMKVSVTEEDEHWVEWIDKIWSFGPKRIGPNLLINTDPNNHARLPSWRRSHQDEVGNRVGTYDPWDSSIETGFQLAMQAGPLCAEPMHGVCVCVDQVQWTEPMSGGQVIRTVRDGIKQVISESSMCRLMLAVYDCEIECLNESLGQVYTSLVQRNGTILNEYLKEGTPYYTVHGVVPVIESFGFIEQIYNRTKGVAVPQLVFKGFQVLVMDPSVVGEDEVNVGRKYMDVVRRRKGMRVDEKLVKDAEKQRTLKK